MHYSLLLLGIASSIPAALADRGSAPEVTPTVCNAEPTITGTNITTKSAVAAAEPVPATSTPAPKLPRRDNRLTKRRGQVKFADNCNDSPPSGSSYNAGTGFPTMKSVLEKAYSDAVTLANQAQNVASNNKGFTHYFGGTQVDTQLTHFKVMMEGIAGSNNNYAIQFECKNTPTCATNSVFVTDATPGSATDEKVIEVCPLFWTAASTKYLLYDSSNTTPSPPYRNNDATTKGWCRKITNKNDPDVSARINRFYATAGHSVLHELTHVDSLAQFAGLSGNPADNGAHGTDDKQRGCELTGARGFLTDYINSQTDGTSPDYNAESYAAAATEIYFMNLCGFSEIRPVVL